MEIIDRLAFGVRWLGDGCGGSKGSSMMDTQPEWKWSASSCMATGCCWCWCWCCPNGFWGRHHPRRTWAYWQRGDVDEDETGLGIDFGIGSVTKARACSSRACDSDNILYRTFATSAWPSVVGRWSLVVGRWSPAWLPRQKQWDSGLAVLCRCLCLCAALEFENKLASTLATTKCHCLHTWITPIQFSARRI